MMMNNSKLCFTSAEILLPDFDKIDGTRWSVVACDQYTSEPAYWQNAKKEVGNTPSTLDMILPEVYLAESETRVPKINEAMKKIARDTLVAYSDAMICLDRVQSDGKHRYGIVGAVDLEQYDYRRGSETLIRATEGTVLERIPPRVAIRRDAPLELPHVMLLIDDPNRTVIEPLLESCTQRKPVYDFDLMLGGGHVCGTLLTKEEQAAVQSALSALITSEQMEARYGNSTLAPLLFAVGDGNHSLAAAKAAYEEVKAAIGVEAALKHPARYALAEIVNLHDNALEFEPIYRVVFGVEPQALLAELSAYTSAQNGNAAPQTMLCITQKGETVLTVSKPEQQLTVGTLQAFLFEYTAKHPEAEVDYIHGEDSLRSLLNRPDAIGFLFDGMQKNELFRSVIYDGALPRKTFSMGHAADKRYYLECRKIK